MAPKLTNHESINRQNCEETQLLNSLKNSLKKHIKTRRRMLRHKAIRLASHGDYLGASEVFHEITTFKKRDALAKNLATLYRVRAGLFSDLSHQLTKVSGVAFPAHPEPISLSMAIRDA